MTDESDSTVGSTVPQPDGQPDRPPLGTQTETVTPEDVAATAQRMLAVLVDDLTARGWPLPDVQALATKMANAAKGEDA